MKLATIVGTRPEIIRLSRVIQEADRHFDHTLIHTGQNYDYSLNQVFFDELGLRDPDLFLNAVGSSLGETVGNVIARSYDALSELKPDACLILGDTNSCIAAYSAKRLKIPIFHMEAGNRCFDPNVPEEINRRMVDHLADINLPYSQIARSYLVAESFPADRIIVTGSPMFEVLNHYRSRIDSSTILEKLGLAKEKFLVASVHREDNVDDPVVLKRILEALGTLARDLSAPVILSTHPRTRANIAKFELKMPPDVVPSEPMGFFDYNKLQVSALMCISDSGTIFEEAAVLGFRAISLRRTHERPEAMEQAVAILVDPGTEDIAASAKDILAGAPDFRAVLPTDYAAPNVAQKVVRIIKSYKAYVNRYVWKKQ